jgi:hypothetical protein
MDGLDSTIKHAPFPPLAPVFPLPNCVLFPKVILPLRIFEPRYKIMLHQILDSRDWLAIALYQRGQGVREQDEAGNPNVYPIGGLGRLVDYQKAEDGTFKVVVLGEHRVRWNGWLQVKPYPIAKLEALRESEPDQAVRDDIRGRLRSRIRELVRRSVDSQVMTLLDKTINECDEIGPLVDRIAYHFLSDPFEKQRLLQEASAVERERLLIEILERERYGGSGNVEPERLPS